VNAMENDSPACEPWLAIHQYSARRRLGSRFHARPQPSPGGRRGPVGISGGLLSGLRQSASAGAIVAGLVVVTATACVQQQPPSVADAGGHPSASGHRTSSPAPDSVAASQPSGASRSVPLPDPCSLVSGNDIRSIFGLDMSQTAPPPRTGECAYTGHLAAPGGGHECECTITLRVQSAPVRSREAVRHIIPSNAPLVEVAGVGDAAFLSSSAYGLCCVTVVKDGVWVDFGPVGTPLNAPVGAMAPPTQSALEAMARLISERIP
jgi:hypothetical protein